MAMVPNNEMMAPTNMIEMENVPGVTNNSISTTIYPEDIATAPSMKQGKKNQLVGSRKKRVKQQKKITSPEPTYIKSKYDLKRKEQIKQNKERLKSLGLDLSIGELAKKMNTSVDGEKRKRVGRGTKKYRVIAQIQRGKLPSKQSLKLIKLYHTGRIAGENISF
jgi:multidrug efflux pump subunit AcrB